MDVSKAKVCQDLKTLVDRLEDSPGISRNNVAALTQLVTVLGYSKGAEMIKLYYKENNYSNALAKAREVIEKYEESLKEGEKPKKIIYRLIFLQL